MLPPEAVRLCADLHGLGRESSAISAYSEGLAIGAAFAASLAGLGTFLIIGFALHNLTEGIGIAAPLLKERPPLWTFVGLALLAGAPAVFGMWLGSMAYSPQWAALALAVGAGAILQVIFEVGAYIARSNKMDTLSSVVSPSVLGGLVAGILVMYGTAALISV